MPAVIGVHQLQRPDLRPEYLRGDHQMHRRLSDLDDLDDGAAAQRNHFSRLRRLGVQHMLGNVMQQTQC